MSLGGSIRLAALVAGLAVVWCGFLPWIGRWRVIERHVATMESREVNPSAMVYTELDRLPLRPRWVEERLILWP